LTSLTLTTQTHLRLGFQESHGCTLRLRVWTSGAWRTIKNFMDENTTAKLVFVGAEPEAERLAFEAVGAWYTLNPDRVVSTVCVASTPPF